MSRLLPSCVRLFLVAETEAALVSRLVARKTETPERMAVRVATAQQELRHLSEFDYGKSGRRLVHVWCECGC